MALPTIAPPAKPPQNTPGPPQPLANAELEKNKASARVEVSRIFLMTLVGQLMRCGIYPDPFSVC